MRTPKSLVLEMFFVLLFGAFTTISAARHSTLTSWLCLLLLVLGVLVSLRGDTPWWHGASFCAFFFAGRLTGNSWLGSHQLRSGPILDDLASIFLVIGIYSFVVNALKARRIRVAKPKSL